MIEKEISESVSVEDTLFKRVKSSLFVDPRILKAPSSEMVARMNRIDPEHVKALVKSYKTRGRLSKTIYAQRIIIGCFHKEESKFNKYF